MDLVQTSDSMAALGQLNKRRKASILIVACVGGVLAARYAARAPAPTLFAGRVLFFGQKQHQVVESS
jgi:hypothetical protein